MDRLPYSSQLLANGIVAATSMLVRNAMLGNWTRTAAIAHERRALLDQLESGRHAADESRVHALRQAVVESDSALAVMGAAQRAAAAGSMQR